MGTQLPLKGAQSPLFGPCLLWPNGWMNQDATWYDARHRLGQHCIRPRCGPSSTPTEHSPLPQFSSHVCCGQTAGSIKMPLGMKVSLGPGLVLYGDLCRPSPPKGHIPQFSVGPCLLWPNGRPSQLLLSTCVVCRRKLSTWFFSVEDRYLIKSLRKRKDVELRNQ